MKKDMHKNQSGCTPNEGCKANCHCDTPSSQKCTSSNNKHHDLSNRSSMQQGQSKNTMSSEKSSLKPEQGMQGKNSFGDKNKSYDSNNKDRMKK